MTDRIDPQLLRSILRRFAAGVTVITSISDEGTPAGMTATAFSSVSISPPMVLVCVDANARTRHAIEGHAGFVVNVLADGQEHVARRFASKVTDKFEGIPWRAGVTGAPVIEGTLATVECTVHHSVEAGTHIIYVGNVLSGDFADGLPLLYFDAEYRTLARAD